MFILRIRVSDSSLFFLNTDVHFICSLPAPYFAIMSLLIWIFIVDSKG